MASVDPPIASSYFFFILLWLTLFYAFSPLLPPSFLFLFGLPPLSHHICALLSMPVQATMLSFDVVIIGAGPTGLGAALRLTERNRTSWCVLDGSDVAGGLSRSVKDDHGFTWDIGGHVIFSHYQYYDDVMELAIDASGWNVHQRESYVYVAGAWVPYPFQNNIHRLPTELREECLGGLERLTEAHAHPPAALNFEQWFTNQFGEGIARVFMRPYNTKLWTVPPSAMSCAWVGERVAQIDLAQIKQNMARGEDDVGWGPNATFRFPKEGGTGGIYRALASRLPRGRVHLGPEHRVVAVDPVRKVLTLRGGRQLRYTALLSSIPLDELLRALAVGLESATGAAPHPPLDAATCRLLADKLDFSSTHIVGLGMRGTVPSFLKTACWLYFPESHICFYRATVFSNYAERNAPEGGVGA
ncbi:UDP-galactopyranose mutase [Strigomonas culicis]|uniref:UDP-galactopyranose mutase n=1 Tax=Strigomonas culicis TaxID=28005 RepID=S9WM59_9TRYP|nr:UDP-galactopyranose mutase [Strigomonas culicis]|eukprot:EPY37090.1 UDP-galactopyranose mutase [Strigomonas culicis]